uniref:Uncharacterized protein n=1 Tax=Triticum urartu TaxID=4572 RepID=A0A8R7R669_TRIUA
MSRPSGWRTFLGNCHSASPSSQQEGGHLSTCLSCWRKENRQITCCRMSLYTTHFFG